MQLMSYICTFAEIIRHFLLQVARVQEEVGVPMTSHGAGMPQNIQCTGTDLAAGAVVMAAAGMTENSEGSVDTGEALPRVGILTVLPRPEAPETWIHLPAVLLLPTETGMHLEMNIIKLNFLFTLYKRVWFT